METGILGYGAYIPRYRIGRDEYVKAWGYFAARGVDEKAVAGHDEDAITMGVEASLDAIKRAGVEPAMINALFFASTSAPYAEKLASTTIATALGLPSDAVVVDFTTSTKAGASAMLSCLDFVMSGRGKYGLAVASDSPYAQPGEALEHCFGAGASAFVIGQGNPVATIEGSHSTTSEILGERFRIDGRKSVEDLGIGSYTELAFNQILTSTITSLMRKYNKKLEDFSNIVLQQFDGRTPYRLARGLGFKDTQIMPGFIVSKIGDAGVSSPLIGLSATLDIAKPNERILVASYGSGAGSDALSLLVHEEIEKCRLKAPLFKEYIENKENINYITYLKFRKMIGIKQ